MTARRNSRLAGRLHWALLPYAHPRPSREDVEDGAVWHWWWLLALWAMRAVERLPGSHLFEPMPPVVCTCDYCRGVPGASFKP